MLTKPIPNIVKSPSTNHCLSSVIPALVRPLFLLFFKYFFISYYFLLLLFFFFFFFLIFQFFNFFFLKIKKYSLFSFSPFSFFPPGTTIFHYLLSLDPLGYAPPLWQSALPTPVLTHDSSKRDPRIEKVSVVCIGVGICVGICVCVVCVWILILLFLI